MLVYNVTVIIEESSAEEWLKWMNETHIPAVMATGKFIDHRVLKVLDSPNEGKTFCIQYNLKNMDDYLIYQKDFAPTLQTESMKYFKDKFVAYRTLMQKI
ncbi:MAG: DUF4286 family protein [Sphingobacteriaceae bacterium]|nr:DUF4286 family protein [Sphingobacteriaceae bacterium]